MNGTEPDDRDALPQEGAEGGPIRITGAEAMSDRVDDLLKRQKNLRGEYDISRKARRWYYQNWFVLGLTGMLAAVVAWALIEPKFADMPYIQGKIEQIGAPERASALVSTDEDVDLSSAIVITVRGVAILVHPKAFRWSNGENEGNLDPASLAVGQEVGVYVVTEGAIPVTLFVDPSPPALPPDTGAENLERTARVSGLCMMLLFPLTAGLVGLCIGAADGLICRLPRRAVLSGLIGVIIGFIGGFISLFIAGLVYMPLNALAMKHAGDEFGTISPLGLIIQVIGRGVAWALAGMAMGLGQGIALRSKRLFLYGFLGGVIGGLLGGLLFDPIDLIVLGTMKPSAHISRLVGLAVIGASVGVMIGVVELLARDAWLQMLQGPLAGKEFLIFKDTMKIGSSPRSDIYLFNDPAVAGHHVTLRAVGDACEIENHFESHPALLNDRPVQRARIRHGDQITIGRTVFVFQRRGG